MAIRLAIAQMMSGGAMKNTRNNAITAIMEVRMNIPPFFTQMKYRGGQRIARASMILSFFFR